MKTDVALNILDNVYAAGTSPEAWQIALGQLGQYFDCSCVSLVKKDLRTSQGTAFQWGVSPSDAREYLTYWLPRNIFHSWTRVWRPGHIETDRTILPKRELLRSDYYNGFLKPHEMHALMRVALHADDRSLHILALARSERKLRASLNHVLDRILAVDRHQPAAHLVSCGRQRDGKIGYHRGFGQLEDFGDQPYRRQCDALRRNSDAIWICHQREGTIDVLQIQQRLAHAHQNDIDLLGRSAKCFAALGQRRFG